VYDAASNTARALHSLLDENVELIMNKIPIMMNNSDDSVIGRNCIGSSSSIGEQTIPDVNTIVKELTRVISNQKVTDTTRLHACGAILSLRKVFIEEQEDAANHNNAVHHMQVCQTLQSCTCTLIIPALHALFSFDANNTIVGGTNNSSPKTMVQQMISLYRVLRDQRQDEAMESEIANEINARKEPARMIARRQKEMKAKKQGVVVENNDKNKKVDDAVDTMDEDKKEDNATIMVEDDSNTENGKAVSESFDPREELEVIMQYWRELCTSQKLALELVANLCSGPNEGDDDEE
jgi:hypothetical protein